ncbi:rod shape-determining protein MreD [Geminocystis sp. NIES-3709]|uniref:rod shape-determining protein MreD n=1 Tax=Geminocystis sp. NIES-3709 TaxID=1617448 RepID=UPI0005FCD4CF|nr:rod shape-determining protein MreD [Geminocystis sp. NIES-3709]BAQ65138.1 rod shape-determining protein MreD [Geminocystis sp. NIES-3709]
MLRRIDINWRNNFWLRTFLVIFSLIICCLFLLIRIPGLELIGITPNWLLIWLITWSVKRNLWQSIVAAICLGLIWDSLTGVFPSHILGLIIVALFTTNVYGDKYIKEDVISLTLIVFGMAIINETIIALQYSIQTQIPLIDIWLNYQKNSLTSAIISSLWTPLIYYPLDYILSPLPSSFSRN